MKQVMKFGIFDHLEQRRGVPLAELYEERLKLVEQADRAGIYCWLTAEHHHSPLCMAPNQMVFFAAAAARTSTIKLGSLVSVLPLHHPVRLLEELCMMDHISKGRLQIGVGKGPTGSEFAMWGGDPEARQEVFDEAMIILLQGMQNEFLDFEGKHFSFSNLWMAVRPYQTPHPPFWYGENAATAGKLRANVVFHGSNKSLVEKIKTYRSRACRGEAGLAQRHLPQRRADLWRDAAGIPRTHAGGGARTRPHQLRGLSRQLPQAGDRRFRRGRCQDAARAAAEIRTDCHLVRAGSCRRIAGRGNAVDAARSPARLHADD